MTSRIGLLAVCAASVLAAPAAFAQDDAAVDAAAFDGAAFGGAAAEFARPDAGAVFAPRRAVVAGLDDSDQDGVADSPFVRPLHLAPVSVRANSENWTTVARYQPCNATTGECSEEDAGRLDIHVNGDRENVQFGALVRLGENLSAPRKDDGGWYVFAAADAQAVTWKPDGGGSSGGAGVRLEERSLIGDAQAGVGVRVGGGDLAFGFVHREYSYDKYSAEEQFGGVTFAITR